MKIDLSYGDVRLWVDFGDVKVNTPAEAMEVMSQIASIVKGHSSTKTQPANAADVTPTHVVTAPPQRDNFGIRQRLPNNVVDISDLNVQQAVTENALVRCPKCGQAHALVVTNANSLYLLRRDYAKDEFAIVQDFELTNQDDFMQASKASDETELDYFYRLQSMSIRPDEDFVVNNDTEVFCPVCKQSSSFVDWKEAWENPLGFFEYEEVCDVCGGELSVCVSPNQTDSSQSILLRECNKCHKRALPTTEKR